MTMADAPMPPADHRAYVFCETCHTVTAHTMAQGVYGCLTCQIRHDLPRLGQKHVEAPQAFPCLSGTCRRGDGRPVLFWKPVNGRRQCRVCQQWQAVVSEGE